MTPNGKIDRHLNSAEVRALTGLSDMSIWRLEKAHQFPARFKAVAGGRDNRWLESEVVAYLEQRAINRSQVGTLESGDSDRLKLLREKGSKRRKARAAAVASA